MTRLLPLLLVLIIFSVFVPRTTSAQKASNVSGRVLSAADNTALPGVNVVVKGTSRGTITDVDGRFTIDIQAPEVLVFSFIGYRAQEILYSGQTNLEIQLQEEPKELSEVVVIGYQSVEKRDITGAITSVKATAFRDLSINGVDQALQGQAAGVQVTASSGTPGGGISVRIRGATSINASNRPLYIVDGVPTDAGTLGVRDFGGQNDNALSMINPGDYESITVLKDAAAKALYGSRASNGVVLITTKKGKAGMSTVTMDVQRGIVDPVHKLDLLNSTELLTLQREAVRNAGQDPDSFGLIPGVTDAVNTNWQNAVLRRAIMEQYQAAVSGGDDKTTYYVGANYRNEEGIQLNNKFQRYGLTMNFEHKVTQRFKLSTQVILSRSLNKRVKGDNFLDGVYSGALQSLPYYTPYDENGRIVGPGSPLYAGFPNFNPVGQAVIPRFNTTTVKTQGFIKGEYKISDHLMAVGQVSIDYDDVTEDQYENTQTAIGGWDVNVGQQGLGVFIAQSQANVISSGRVLYNNTIGKHRINAIGGSELLQNFALSGDVSGRLFPSDDFSYLTSAGVIDQGSSLKSAVHSIVSFIGSTDYDYDDRFLATLSMRADGSSNFGANHKFGYFPAASFGWRISNEKFFKAKAVNDLKIRGSFGYTGNERIPAFTYLATWGATTYSGSSGTSPNGLDNPDIKWETTRELNIGADISLFESRIQATVEVYDKYTTDLLLAKPYASTTGFGSLMSNIGKMQNRGIELSINSVNLDGAFKWRTSLNVSRNMNKVLALVDSLPLYSGYIQDGVNATNVIKQGYPLGSFWGLNFLGVNPATGNAMYEDVNKDGVINNADGKVIGTAQPKLFGGITNTFSYKGFDLSVLVNFSWGNSILNLTKSNLVNAGKSILVNQMREALDRWQKPGDITDVPKYILNNTFNSYQSNRFLEDGSYLRLKNVSFGYNIPPILLNRFKVSKMRVYVTATNLLTWTKYDGSDPEVSTLDGSTASQGIDFNTLPQVRTIAGGLSITL
jgi:TonB-linked SusC/RagA family outer membrane protein